MIIKLLLIILLFLHPVIKIDQPVLSNSGVVTGVAWPNVKLYMRVYQDPIVDIQTTTASDATFRFETDLTRAQAVLVVTEGGGLSGSALVTQVQEAFLPMIAR